MRIVNRSEFLTLPAGTIYAKFAPQPKNKRHVDLTYEEVAIKGETCGEDFLVQDLFPEFIGVQDDSEHSQILVGMLDGKPSPPLDYECEGRDGLFAKDQLFAVWSRDDAERLVKRLQEALATGYPHA